MFLFPHSCHGIELHMCATENLNWNGFGILASVATVSYKIAIFRLFRTNFFLLNSATVIFGLPVSCYFKSWNDRIKLLIKTVRITFSDMSQANGKWNKQMIRNNAQLSPEWNSDRTQFVCVMRYPVRIKKHAFKAATWIVYNIR